MISSRLLARIKSIIGWNCIDTIVAGLSHPSVPRQTNRSNPSERHTLQEYSNLLNSWIISHASVFVTFQSCTRQTKLLNYLRAKQHSSPLLPKNHKHPLNLTKAKAAVANSKAWKKFAVRVLAPLLKPN